MVTTLDWSYSAEKEWCASTVIAERSSAMPAIRIIGLVLIKFFLLFRKEIERWSRLCTNLPKVKSNGLEKTAPCGNGTQEAQEAQEAQEGEHSFLVPLVLLVFRSRFVRQSPLSGREWSYFPASPSVS